MIDLHADLADESGAAAAGGGLLTAGLGWLPNNNVCREFQRKVNGDKIRFSTYEIGPAVGDACRISLDVL